MSAAAWQTAHSVDSHASLPFAWAYMTNVKNWDDPPATFELDGPFASGTRGATRMPNQEPMRWQLAEVHPLESYRMEAELDGAVMSFEWRFDGTANGTRLTQHITLGGENATAYVSMVQAAFESNLVAGMSRIAAAIERAEAGGESGHSSGANRVG